MSAPDYDARRDYEESCKLATTSNRLPILAAEINTAHRAAFGAAEKALEHAAECGRRLIEAKGLLPHGHWLPWLEANTEVGVRQSQKYMRLAQGWDEIKYDPSSHLTINGALDLISEHGRHPITLSTGNSEWFTPLEVLDAVRTVFGGEICLDPASCAEAQERVRARAYFDEHTDGLMKPWHGRVFLNPPYSAPVIRAFVEKLVNEVSTGRVEQAILLAEDRTDAAWFQQAASAARLFCFMRRRPSFYSPDRGDSRSPIANSALFYFGNEEDRFRAAFSEVAYFCRLVTGGAP